MGRGPRRNVWPLTRLAAGSPLELGMAVALRGFYELAGALAWAWGLPAAHLPPVILTSVPCLKNLRSPYLAQISGWQGKGLAWAGILQRDPPPLGPRPPPSLSGQSPSQTPWVYKTRVMVHRGRGQRIPAYSGLQKRLLQVGNCRRDHPPGSPRLGRAAVIWGPAQTPTQQGATEVETARAPQLNVAGPCRCP